MVDFDTGIDRKGSDSLKWSVFPEDVLPMWVADSDFPAPQPVIDALQARAAHGAYGYAAMDGELDKAARHWMRSRFNWDVPEGSAAYAPGVCAAVAVAIEAFTRPGEGIVAFTPSYPPLINLPETTGRSSVRCALRETAQGYAVDFEDLERRLAEPKVTLLLLCNPHNPTGKVFTRDELERIGSLCRKHGVLVFSDEIHCDYVFSGQHIPFSSLSPELAAISLVSINPSKTFNIAGLHTAAVLAENHLLLERFKLGTAKVGLHSTFMGVTAFRAAYLESAAYADAVAAYVRDNLSYAVQVIQEQGAPLKAAMPASTYLLWLDCRGLGLSDSQLMHFFIKQAKVAPSSGADFGEEGKGFVRLNLACPRSLVSEGLRRIITTLNNR